LDAGDETRRFLVGAREREQFRLAVQFAENVKLVGVRGRRRSGNRLVVEGIFRRVAAAQPVRQNHSRVSRQIRNYKLLAVVGATITSKLSKTFATASIASLRARAAWMYSTAGMKRAVRNVFANHGLSARSAACLCHCELDRQTRRRFRVSIVLMPHKESWHLDRHKFTPISRSFARAASLYFLSYSARARPPLAVFSAPPASFVLRESRAVLPLRPPAGRPVFVRMLIQITTRSFPNPDSNPN